MRYSEESRGEEEREITGNGHAGNVPLEHVEIHEFAEWPRATPNNGFGTYINLKKNRNGSDTENRKGKRYCILLRGVRIIFFIYLVNICLTESLSFF